MNISPFEHKSICYAIANLDARDFLCAVSGVGRERCAHICLAPSQNPNVWRSNIHVWTPLWTYFLVTCPRLDPNDGITGRGCPCMSPEETVVVLVQCFYTDVAKISISNFRRVGTTFSGAPPQARTVLLFSSYSGQIFQRRNILTCRRK